jgi:hypothetical protein
MWDPQRLITLWAFTACYRDSYPTMSWSSLWSLSFWLSHQNPICIPVISHSCYMPSPSQPPRRDHSKLYFATSTSYEAPHYAAFCNLLSLHLSSVQVFSSTSSSQTPTVYGSSLNGRDQVSHPYRNTGKIDEKTKGSGNIRWSERRRSRLTYRSKKFRVSHF